MPRLTAATTDEMPRPIREAHDFIEQRTAALRNMLAHRYGWPSEAVRKVDEDRLTALGVRIAHRRREMNDAPMAALDIEESLRDWIAGREFTFAPGVEPTLEGIDYLVGMASLGAWYTYRHEVTRAEQDAWELGDDMAAAHAHRIAEMEGAA